MKTFVALIVGAAIAPTGLWATDETQLLRKCLPLPERASQRLDCYDKVIWPKLRGGASQVRLIGDCRFLVEDDARVNCYNGFLDTRSARVVRFSSPPRPPVDVPSAAPPQAKR
jgi:hypothetical protein